MEINNQTKLLKDIQKNLNFSLSKKQIELIELKKFNNIDNLKNINITNNKLLKNTNEQINDIKKQLTNINNIILLQYKINDIINYFDYHNKNLTKKQYLLIDELKELFYL